MISSQFKNNHRLHVASSKHRTFANASNNGTTAASSHKKNYFLVGSTIEGKLNHHREKCTILKLFVHIR
jgi:hypothetical protein